MDILIEFNNPNTTSFVDIKWEKLL